MNQYTISGESLPASCHCEHEEFSGTGQCEHCVRLVIGSNLGYNKLYAYIKLHKCQICIHQQNMDLIDKKSSIGPTYGF